MTFTIQRQRGLRRCVPCMCIAHKRLKPIGLILHGNTQQPCYGHCCHLVGIRMQLNTKCPSHIGTNHANLAHGNGKLPCINFLHLKGRLMRLMHRQRTITGVEPGHHSTRLQGNASLATERKAMCNHVICFLESQIGIIFVKCSLERQIAVQGRMCKRRIGQQCLLCIDNGIQIFPIDVYKIKYILCLCPRLGNNRKHRLTLPIHLVNRQGMLRRGLMLRK